MSDDEFCPECGSPHRPALTRKRGGSPGEMERCRNDEWHDPHVNPPRPHAESFVSKGRRGFVVARVVPGGPGWPVGLSDHVDGCEQAK